MGLLDFSKPKKLRSTDKHNNMYQSDSGIAGTYVPNMSDVDKLKWKAKHISGSDERIEIRKTMGGINILLVVYKNIIPKTPDMNWRDWSKCHNNIKMSMNGKLDMTYSEFNEINQAILEAKEILEKK